MKTMALPPKLVKALPEIFELLEMASEPGLVFTGQSKGLNTRIKELKEILLPS